MLRRLARLFFQEVFIRLGLACLYGMCLDYVKKLDLLFASTFQIYRIFSAFVYEFAHYFVGKRSNYLA